MTRLIRLLQQTNKREREDPRNFFAGIFDATPPIAHSEKSLRLSLRLKQSKEKRQKGTMKWV